MFLKFDRPVWVKLCFASIVFNTPRTTMSFEDSDFKKVIPRTFPEWKYPSTSGVAPTIGNAMRKKIQKKINLAWVFQRAGPRKTLEDPQLMEHFNVMQPVRQVKPEIADTFAQSMQAEMNKMNSMVTDFRDDGIRSRPKTMDNFDFNYTNPIQDDSNGNKVFQLVFDTRKCKPDDILIDTYGKGLAVHCMYEEEENGVTVSRKYFREYLLPSKLNQDLLKHEVSADGTLKISIPF